MHGSPAKIGFENGARVQIVENDPSQINTPVHCGACDHVGDARCGACGSIQVLADAVPQDAKTPRSINDERLRLLFLKAHDYPNSKFFLVCVLIATGDPAAAGKTMEEVASTWGVGKAAVSKLCCLICAFLDIDPGPYMKSKAAKKSYRASNRRPRKV